MAKRRFELVEGTSSKFWEVNLAGASFTVTFGRIGTAGQSKVKKCKDAAAAKAEVEKLIAEKTKKGYSPAGGKKPAVASKKPAKAPAKVVDPYRPAADALVAALEAAAGNVKKEERAIQKAIDQYMEIAGGGILDEMMIPEYFAEDGSVQNPPAVERVKGATEADIFRWRMKLADLCGY